MPSSSSLTSFFSTTRQCLLASLMMTNWLVSSAEAGAAKPRTRAAATTYFKVMGFLRIGKEEPSHRCSKTRLSRSAQNANNWSNRKTSGRDQIAGQRPGDQRAGFVDAIE